MLQTQISDALYSCFEAGAPTDDQANAMGIIGEFLSSYDFPLLVLKGSAGTGKTSLISAITKVLPVLNMKYVQLAPTGRAAKVMQQYSGSSAFTIHRYIYATRNTSTGYTFELKYNRQKNTLYIIDEASMLGNDEAQQSLLHDLFEFAFSGENNRILLVGDYAQLPPVGKNDSPALNEDYLRNAFSVQFKSISLREVVRQASESVILKNATLIRECIDNEIADFPQLETGKDVIRLNDAITSQEAFDGAFYKPLEMESVVLVRSNKRANLYNQELRNRIMYKEEEISAGDLLMNTRNNYFWLDDKSPTGFIANGDMLEVIRPGKEEFQYGFRFRHATVQMVDYPDQPAFDTILMLDTLMDESPSLHPDKNRAFLQSLWDEDPNLSKAAFWAKVRKNAYFNALQVKFAYAITVHKSQGGQWRHVFIEQPYLPDGTPSVSDLRWLYTAITRATEKVYLMGFSDAFFK